MRIFDYFLFHAVALLSLGGCSKPLTGSTEGERTAITVSATLPVGAAEASTKAVVDGSTALTFSFARADETSAGCYGAYGAEFTGTREAGTGSMALTFNPRQFYQIGGFDTRIIGWYPGGAVAAGNPEGFYDASTGTVCWTIDGQQDILSASAQGSRIAAMPGFVFNHRLAQIQFWLYAGNAAMAALWGPVKSITLLNQPNQYTMTLPDPATTEAGAFTATGDADFMVRNLPSGNLPTTATMQGDPVMIAPTTDKTTLSLIIDMADGNRYIVTVPERTYPAGSVTAVKLRFHVNGVEVRPSITISNWANAGELNLYPKVENGNTIVLVDDIGLADPSLYPLHEAWTSTPSHEETLWTANASGYNTCGRKFVVAEQMATLKDGYTKMMNWQLATGTKDDTYNPTGYSACFLYSESSDESDKTQWRVPTVKELALIEKLTQSGELTSALQKYKYSVWAATSKNGKGWYHAPNAENPTSVFAGSPEYYTLCVRDLEEPGELP